MSHSQSDPQPFFNGVLTSPNNFYDEGIEHALDLLQETAGINAICVYIYQRMAPAASKAMPADHGKPIDWDRNNDQLVWVQINDQYYSGTSLRHNRNKPDAAWAGKDILADLRESAAARGIKVYARILEGWNSLSGPGFYRVHEQDLHGRMRGRPCYNHPDYIDFWVASTEDLSRTYSHINGIYWGSENGGPLREVLGGKTPGCFCPHCRERARKRGINVERAIRGFRTLQTLCMALRAGERPTDGAFVSIMRVLLDFPEILAWEKMWVESYYTIPRLMQGTMKAINPELELGFHADNAMTGVDIFKRIDLRYEDLAEFCDWIKPCNYLAAAGTRMRGNLSRYHQTLLADLDPQRALEFYYQIHGFDPSQQPTFDELGPDKTMTTDYTTREVSRAVAGVGGNARIYAGNAINIPTGASVPWQDPEFTYRDITAALEAGAHGLLLSREYQELDIPNLKAVGRAVRDWQSQGLGR